VAHRRLLRSGALGAHLLLAIIAWVVDRLLSKSSVMLIPFHLQFRLWVFCPVGFLFGRC